MQNVDEIPESVRKYIRFVREKRVFAPGATEWPPTDRGSISSMLHDGYLRSDGFKIVIDAEVANAMGYSDGDDS